MNPGSTIKKPKFKYKPLEGGEGLSALAALKGSNVTQLSDYSAEKILSKDKEK